MCLGQDTPHMEPSCLSEAKLYLLQKNLQFLIAGKYLQFRAGFLKEQVLT